MPIDAGFAGRQKLSDRIGSYLIGRSAASDDCAISAGCLNAISRLIKQFARTEPSRSPCSQPTAVRVQTQPRSARNHRE
jgi:hypothetical protein